MLSSPFLSGLLRWMVMLLLALPTFAAERAYWVWHRAAPLNEGEAAELRAQGVKTLYWQVATVNEAMEARICAREVGKLAPGFRVVPVVRVEKAALPSREEFLRLARFASEGALQLDFDLPDRALGKYAAHLAALRATVPHLGITALAHWPSVKEFPELARSVEELCPMFYDLQNDPTGVSAKDGPPPILDPAQTGKLLAGWSACPTPWRAGLPVFARLTIFDATGLSRGQIPDWEWDEVAFQKHLRTLGPTRLGVTLLRADAATLFGRRPLREGDTLAVRTTDRAALAACTAAAEKAGAAGVVLFRLPAAGSAATWSLRSLREAEARPKLTLRREGDALILQNEGGADLEPRLSGERHDRDRGFTLEIDSPAPVFREAEAGAFFRVAAHVIETEDKPRPASVATAGRLTFWFSQLPAGGSLRSGIFQLAPATDPAKLRWRSAGSDWQSILSP